MPMHCVPTEQGVSKLVGHSSYVHLYLYEFDWPHVHVRIFECVLLDTLCVFWSAVLEKSMENDQ